MASELKELETPARAFYRELPPERVMGLRSRVVVSGGDGVIRKTGTDFGIAHMLLGPNLQMYKWIYFNGD